jgi:hypothetical protein
MAFLQTKLQKLSIHAYSKRSRSNSSYVDTFTAMFNPESFSQKYEIKYGKHQSLNSTNKQVLYSHSKPRELALKLILDGTGVHEMGIHKLKPQPSVSDRVEHFINLTFRMKGKIHEPSYLIAEWGGQEDGGLIFSCRLLNVNVNYTSFNRDGSPLRAELDIVLISDKEVKKRLAEEDKNSPDLTHYRVVKEGDTLPLLTKEIYGTSKYYLQIAQINNLDNFRQLTPGTELFFPPLER